MGEAVAYEDRIYLLNCSISLEMRKNVLGLILSSCFDNVMKVSAVAIRAPLSWRQRHSQSLLDFSSAVQPYTIPALLILLLEVYVKYDVTEVSM